MLIRLSITFPCREKERHIRDRQIISFHSRCDSGNAHKNPLSGLETELWFVSPSDRMASLSLGLSVFAFPCHRAAYTVGWLCRSSPRKAMSRTHTSHAVHPGSRPHELDRRGCIHRAVSCPDSREEYRSMSPAMSFSPREAS